MLSVTTDFATDCGSPRSDLERIAHAGFTHVHWCHHWASDFLYHDAEIQAIRGWLSELGLSLLDIHGSVGREKAWCSLVEYERLAGVELVANRVRMARWLGADVVIMHLPAPLTQGDSPAWDAVRRSLDGLVGACDIYGVTIALENGASEEGEAAIARCLGDYPPSIVGVCYDCGHGNMAPDGLAWLESVRTRLVSVHLHDNDGVSDLHMIPFTGTVEWERLAALIARSSYTKCLSLEVSTRNSVEKEPETFLANARRAGERLAGMVSQSDRL